jgi:hypothetical protein
MAITATVCPPCTGFDDWAVAMPGYLFVLVVGAMLLTAIATILLGRRKTAREGEYNAEGLGFIGGVLNALFIVVLAFYTVITWTNTDTTEQHTRAEAAGLIEIYWQVAATPDPGKTQIRALVTEYTKEVATTEWTTMDNGKSDPKADDLLVALRSEITALPADSDVAAALRDKALDNIRNVADERRARVSDATGDHTLLKILLLGTIIGGIAMVAYPLLIGFEATLRHIISLTFMAGLLAFAIYFSLELDQPFSGLIKVEPDAFRAALVEYGRIP